MGKNERKKLFFLLRIINIFSYFASCEGISYAKKNPELIGILIEEIGQM